MRYDVCVVSSKTATPRMCPTDTRPSHVTRRYFLRAAGLLAAGSAWASARSGQGDSADASVNTDVEYGRQTLPPGIRSRRVDNNNGLTMHILEAGFETPGPCVLLLHGFPELAYTWRNQLLALSRAGFHVVAPDLRGYGLTAPKPVRFEDDLLPYLLSNRVVDVLGLTRALGHERVAAVIGHDWGAPTAQWCAMARPDVFQSVVSMSNPFYDSGTLPLDTANRLHAAQPDVDIQKELAALPRPRKHYIYYSATREANENMWHAPQGVHDLLRAMYWFKSANWPVNKPFSLKSWTAAELAKLPAYYVMDLDKGIAKTMATAKPSKEQIALCRWMTKRILRCTAPSTPEPDSRAALTPTGFSLTRDTPLIRQSLPGEKSKFPHCTSAARGTGVFVNPQGHSNRCTTLAADSLAFTWSTAPVTRSPKNSPKR